MGFSFCWELNFEVYPTYENQEKLCLNRATDDIDPKYATSIQSIVLSYTCTGTWHGYIADLKTLKE